MPGTGKVAKPSPPARKKAPPPTKSEGVPAFSIAPIGRLISNILGKEIKVSKDSKDGLSQAAAKAVIHFAELSYEETVEAKRVILKPEDIVGALEKLEIPDLIEELREFGGDKLVPAEAKKKSKPRARKPSKASSEEDASEASASSDGGDDSD